MFCVSFFNFHTNDIWPGCLAWTTFLWLPTAAYPHFSRSNLDVRPFFILLSAGGMGSSVSPFVLTICSSRWMIETVGSRFFPSSFTFLAAQSASSFPFTLSCAETHSMVTRIPRALSFFAYPIFPFLCLVDSVLFLLV